MMRPFARFLGLLCVVMLAGCIDVREELWLTADGSARLEARYEFPSAATLSLGGADKLQANLIKLLSQNDAIRHHDCRVTESNQRTRIHITLETDDVRQLYQAISNSGFDGLPPAAEELIGRMDVVVNATTVDMERRISPGQSLPALKLIPPAQLQGHQLVYILHLPDAAIQHNATESWDDRRSLLWEIPLEQAIKREQLLHVRARLPIPWWPLGVATAAIAAVVTGWSIRRRKPLSKPSNPSPSLK